MSAQSKAPLGMLPPAWFLLAIALMAATHWLAPLAELLRWPWRAAGLVLLAVGLALPLAGAMRFNRHGTTIKPFQPSTSLVTDGVHGYSRNPMYLGLVLMLAGLAVLLGTLGPWLVVVAFQQWISWMFVRPEERGMAEQFGEAYASYRSRVRRWL